jgi:N-succinyldiaminopimelate aminotransferase
VGWISGRAPLVAAVRAAKQFLTYTSPAPFQLAIARGLQYPAAVMGALAADLAAQRDQLCDGLAMLGYEVIRPAATYFATTDIAPVAPGVDALEFCLALPERCGVVAIPSSVFYDPSDPGAGRTLVRWAFCKRPDVLDDALTRLASWGP